MGDQPVVADPTPAAPTTPVAPDTTTPKVLPANPLLGLVGIITSVNPKVSAEYTTYMIAVRLLGLRQLGETGVTMKVVKGEDYIRHFGDGGDDPDVVFMPGSTINVRFMLQNADTSGTKFTLGKIVIFKCPSMLELGGYVNQSTGEPVVSRGFKIKRTDIFLADAQPPISFRQPPHVSEDEWGVRCRDYVPSPDGQSVDFLSSVRTVYAAQPFVPNFVRAEILDVAEVRPDGTRSPRVQREVGLEPFAQADQFQYASIIRAKNAQGRERETVKIDPARESVWKSVLERVFKSGAFDVFVHATWSPTAQTSLRMQDTGLSDASPMSAAPLRYTRLELVRNATPDAGVLKLTKENFADLNGVPWAESGRDAVLSGTPFAKSASMIISSQRMADDFEGMIPQIGGALDAYLVMVPTPNSKPTYPGTFAALRGAKNAGFVVAVVLIVKADEMRAITDNIVNALLHGPKAAGKRARDEPATAPVKRALADKPAA